MSFEILIFPNRIFPIIQVEVCGAGTNTHRPGNLFVATPPLETITDPDVDGRGGRVWDTRGGERVQAL